MKKTLLAMAMAMTAGLYAADLDYTILWQVSGDSGYSFQGAQILATINGADEPVKLWGGFYLNEGTSGPETLTSTPVVNSSYKYNAAGNSIAENSISSFYIELYNYVGGSWTAIAESQPVSWSDAQAYMAYNGSGSSTSSATTGGSVWTLSSFSQIPEPTSGLLMLLGLAGLALKRKIG